jgi:hypothetical protein
MDPLGYGYLYRYQPDMGTGIHHFLLKTDTWIHFFKIIKIVLIMVETIYI